jgi:peptidoglycan glycosyltransferase
MARRVTDDETEQAHGEIGLKRALVESCNVYFAQAAVGMGAGPLFEMATERFGLALKDVPDAAKLDAALADSAYGQGPVTVTPLDMARVAATIVNGGHRVTPTLYPVKAGAGPKPDQVVRAATAETLRGWMIEVVEHGTGTRAAVEGATVGGKTGTAQNASNDGASHAWFVGFAWRRSEGPARSVAFAFLIENGGYGGGAAAQAAHDFVHDWLATRR